MTEFRKYGRSPLAGKVKLTHRDLGEFFAEDGDISATGLFLKLQAVDQTSTAGLAIGDELAAELPHAPDEPGAETLLRVVRVTDDGVGMAFV